MMEEYRTYREAAMKMYQEQRPLRLELRGGVFTALEFTAMSQNSHLSASIFAFCKQGRKEREAQPRFVTRPHILSRIT